MATGKSRDEDARAQRLARALRDNLRRRKAAGEDGTGLSERRRDPLSPRPEPETTLETGAGPGRKPEPESPSG